MRPKRHQYYVGVLLATRRDMGAIEWANANVGIGNQGGTYTQAYGQGNGLLRRGSEYPLFDGHGSERTVTNSSQTVTGSVNFEAFGQVTGSSGSRTGQIGPMGRIGLGPPTATQG